MAQWRKYQSLGQTAAACITMDTILGQGQSISEDASDEAASSTDKSADKHGLVNRIKVMMLHDLCAKKGFRLDPQACCVVMVSHAAVEVCPSPNW